MSLRVLFPFIGDTVGGSHVSAWQLVNALPEFGVEPIVLLHIGDGYHASWLREQGGEWRVASLPILRADRRIDVNVWRILRGVYPAGKLLKEWHIDLVHGNDGRVNRAWAPWARVAGIPMVWHQRVRWTDSRQVRCSLPFTAGVVSISKYVAGGAPVFSVPHRTIYNPVAWQKRDRHACAKALRAELGLADDVVIIGCFANAQQWKRPDTVVALDSLLAQHRPGKVRVIWFGNDRDGILGRLIAKAGPECSVSLLPFRSDVLSAMAACDVLLAASESEPFGRTLVEAMVVGVPVVASDAGGHREIIEHGVNGLLFPVGDAHACFASIRKLLADEKLRDRLVVNGQQTARHFSPERHAAAVADFYREIMASGRGAT